MCFVYSGTKTGSVGQTFQQQSQQGQQLYMFDPSVQQNYLQNTGVMQRGPAGPVQNNVVPALQPSSSFYSNSTGIVNSHCPLYIKVLQFSVSANTNSTR